MNPKHLIVNCVYTVVSILCLIVLALSYRYKFFHNAMWPLSVVVTIR